MTYEGLGDPAKSLLMPYTDERVADAPPLRRAAALPSHQHCTHSRALGAMCSPSAFVIARNCGSLTVRVCLEKGPIPCAQ